MASPHGDSFYCLDPDELGEGGLLAYHSVTLFSALLGLVGAVHQIRVWKQFTPERQRSSSIAPSYTSDLMTQSMSRRTWEQASVRTEASQTTTGRGSAGFVDPAVVLGLAKADALACIALIVRSIMAFSFKPPRMEPVDAINGTGNATTLPMTTVMHGVGVGDSIPVDGLTLSYPNHWWYELLGGPVEFFLLYFYVATFLWTLTYALSVNFNLANNPLRPLRYKLVCWILPVVPAGTSMFARFYPSGVRCATRNVNLYITYSGLYVPILIVMIANPFIYVRAFRKVSQVLKQSGQVTQHSRQMALAVKYKFLLILFFFYVCWTVNIFDGLLQFFGLYQAPPLAVWLVEAVVNPLQGLFNAVIYGRHTFFKTCLMSLTRRRTYTVLNEEQRTKELTESDRLLRADAPTMATAMGGETRQDRSQSITASVRSNA